MSADDRSLVPQALEYLDPAQLSYEEWLDVGMGLHAEGYTAMAWDGWSRRDQDRYHPGECFAKWSGFGNGSGEIAGGTIVKMARDRGFIPEHTKSSEPDVALDWDAPIIDTAWIEPAEVTEPTGDDWDPVQQVIDYLEALFDADDIVGYVTTAFERDGRWTPKGKGDYTRTAGELIDELGRKRSIENVLGTPNTKAGAWVRFNPLSGEGVRNADVADFRYALVESDDMPIEEQKALIDELQLPCAAIVHSGGKSVHAIVHVDAKDYGQYRDRVDKLYSICSKNGLKIDTQNKNPSRLSRLPGFIRGENRQYLVSKACGKGSWAEWIEWIDEQSDDLPDAESLADAWDDMPALAPPLIDGVLRQGHKLLLAGPSKAGKSFLLIELCVAIAEGTPWLGFTCAQGRVLYVNLELDRASCLNRFRNVYTAAGIPPANLGNIDIWNLRGKSKPMDQLAPALIRRALKTRPDAVVIDPIYKVITGDENSADQMAKFCNQFDRIATEVGCSVIYCHHHSKGAQGAKRSIDRASGSGVFARDPDAQLDMIQLPLSDDVYEAIGNTVRCEALAAFADGHIKGWREHVGDDDKVVADKFVSALRGLLGGDRATEADMLNASAKAYSEARARTAWRVEGILREFPGFAPVNLWFNHPLHSVDTSGILGDLEPEESLPPWKKAVDKHKKNAGTTRMKRRHEFAEAIANAAAGEPPTVQELAGYLGVSTDTVNRRIKNFGAIKTKQDDSTYVVSMPEKEEK